MANYYIAAAANGGDDGNAGTQLLPMLTYAHALSVSGNNPDTFLLNGADIARETVTQGFAGQTFGSYGTGKGIIDAGDPVTGWAAVSAPTEDTGGIFASGFETGDLTQWTTSEGDNGTTVAASATAKLHGSYGLLYTAGSVRDCRGFVTKTFASQSSGSVYVRGYFYIPTGALVASKAFDIVKLGTAANNNQIHVVLQTDGAGAVSIIGYGNAPFFTAYAGVAGEVTLDAWHSFEAEFKIHATQGGGSLKLDNALKGSSYVTDTSGKTIDQVLYGPSNFGDVVVSGATLRFDDLKIDTSAIGAFPGAPANCYSVTLASAPIGVWFNNVRGTKCASEAALANTNDWYYDSGATTLYIISATDPAAKAITVPVRANCLTTNGKDQCTVSGLTLRRPTNANVLNAGASYCTVTASDLLDSCYCGYLSTGTSGHNTVTLSTISGWGQHAISALYNGGNTDNGSNLYTYNAITDGDWNPVTSPGDGEAICCAASNDEIAYNHIHDLIALGTITYNDAISVGPLTGVTGVKIHHNTISGIPYGSGIFFEGSGDVYNNIVGTCYYAGVLLWCSLDEDRTARLYRNVVTGCNVGVTGGSTHQARLSLTLAHNVLAANYNTAASQYTEELSLDVDLAALVVQNNIFSGSADFHNELSSVTQTHATWDYNLWQYGSRYYNSGARNWATWQGYGFDAHGLNAADPLFTNPATGDFTLQSGSPCRNAGVVISGINDGTGGSTHWLGSAPDIGAYEFGEGPPPERLSIGITRMGL